MGLQYCIIYNVFLLFITQDVCHIVHAVVKHYEWWTTEIFQGKS